MATFDEYARAHVAGLLRLAGVLSRDRHTAEDVVQEVLLRASRRWERIDQLDVPDAYVRRMVVNEYLSWRRKWSRIAPEAEVDSGVTVDDHGEELAERAHMTARLRQLPPQQRAVLVLRYYEGLTDTEIADVLRCSHGAVRTAASRALSTLRVTDHETLQPIERSDDVES